MRQDAIALVLGLCFIIALLGGMWGWGVAEGWHALSGYYHYDVNTSEERFMPEPIGCNDTSVKGRSQDDCVGTWYYWKLPPSEITVSTRAIVWLCYSLHQIFVWGLIYRAQLTVTQQAQEGKKVYSTKLRWFNWSLLLVNAFFHVIHLVQTHWTYGATAQDVNISSSQASVIMMLCFVILMEYKDRGLILMWPNPKSDDKVANALRLHPGPTTLIRKYHGVAFAWACIYTFWYHPMENTWGHTLGFFHTAIVLLQGSLAFTEIHLNRYWRLLNECWVIIHGTAVAFQTGNPEVKSRSDLWPLFLFGFGFMFAFTQVYGLPFWKRLPVWARIFPPVIYFAVVCALCGTVVSPAEPGQSGFSRMYEMVFIPSEEYLQVLLSWLFLYLFIIIESKMQSQSCEKEEAPTDSKEVGIEHVKPSPTKQALYLGFIILIYALMVLLAYLYEQAEFNLNITVGMILFTFIYSLLVCVTLIIFKQLIGPHRSLIASSPNKVHSQNSNVDSNSDVGSKSTQSSQTYDNMAFKP